MLWLLLSSHTHKPASVLLSGSNSSLLGAHPDIPACLREQEQNREQEEQEQKQEEQEQESLAELLFTSISKDEGVNQHSTSVGKSA